MSLNSAPIVNGAEDPLGIGSNPVLDAFRRSPLAIATGLPADLTFATEGELAITLMREALTDGVGFDPQASPLLGPA